MAASRNASVRRTSGRFERRIAPGIYERHERACGLSRALSRSACTCEPAFLARAVDPQGKRQSATRSTIADAALWLERLRGHALDAAEATAGQEGAQAAVTLEGACRWFLQRAVRGELVNRSGDRYSEATLRSYETQLRIRVLPYVDPRDGRQFAELPLEAVTSRTAQALANHLASTASAATTRTAMAALQAVMRVSCEAGLTEMERPTRLRLPSAPRPRKRVLRGRDVTRLLEAARADDDRFDRSFAYPLFRLMSTTGARVSELLRLDWGPTGLDLESRPPVMRIGVSKTDAGVRDVWLDEETAEIMRAHRKATTRAGAGTPVFRRPNGERATRAGVTRACVRRVAASVGLEGVSPHVFRHSHVTQLVADGASIVDIAARVGHADPRHTLSLYAKPTDAGQARIVALLEASN